MRRLFLLLCIVVLVHTASFADTIYLKNGSVLKGKVTSFADDQFTVLIDTGSGRYLSRANVYVGDVARVEFDAGAATVSSVTESNEPAAQPKSTEINPGKEVPIRQVDQPRSKEPESKETARDVSPAEQPKQTEPQPKPAEPEVKESTPPSHDPEPAVTPVSTSESTETEKPARKSAAPLRTINVDVVGRRDWTSSGLIVKRGDRLRITATGTVTLDPANGKASGPEGVPDLPDPKKLMPDRATGALIGVISADNDDFFFIGRSTEFTAARDGLLFLSVNEGTLSDNSGTYHAVIEVLSVRKSQ